MMILIHLEVCTSPTFDHGILEPLIHGLYKSGDQVNVLCTSIYAPVSATTTCASNRNWKPTPLCSDITCSVPAVANGMYFLNNKHVYSGHNVVSGSVIELICSIGYTVTPITSRICRNNRLWSEPAPACYPVTCLNLPPFFEFGKYNHAGISSPYPYNFTIRPSCFVGYYLYQGSNRQCTGTTNNAWSGENPVCSPITCRSPYVISHGSYNKNQEVYSYGSTLVPSCDTGYYMVNNVTQIVCEQQNTWSAKQPVCQIVQCREPTVTNGELLYQSISFTYSMQVTIKCHDGYEIEDGAYIRTCHEDGTWGTHPLQCNKIVCNNTNYVRHNGIEYFPPLAYGNVLNVPLNNSLFFLKNGSLAVSCSWDRELRWISAPELGMKLFGCIVLIKNLLCTHHPSTFM